MPDNDHSAFRLNKIHMPDPKSAQLALLTLERAQKLDLLIHLITNLDQSLVICGPNGIGKTTLLEELKKCNKDAVPILNVDASSSLSFESFQNQLARLIGSQNNFPIENQAIPDILPVLDKQSQKVVIIIDNAGQLVPGLINTLIQFVEVNQCLRLVLSLTHDELHLIKKSDRELEYCHFIDIPPLTEKQCGVFLRNLATQSGAMLSYKDINDQFIEKLYRKTYGIPGKIISEVSKGNDFNSINLMNYKWIWSVLTVAFLVTIGVFLFLDEPQLQQSKDNKLPRLIQETEAVETIAPYGQPEIPKTINNTAENLVHKNDLEIDEIITTPAIKPKFQIQKGADKIEESQVEEGLFEQNKKEENVVISKVKIAEIAKKDEVSSRNVKPEVDLEKPSKIIIKNDKTKVILKQAEKKANKKKVVPKKGVISISDDSEWILKQPKNYYTMQLIVLSKRESVLGFLKEYPKLLDKIKFFQKRKQGNSQFVVIYGSFKNAVAASKEMKSLPPRFRKTWVRSFSGLQKMIKK